MYFILFSFQKKKHRKKTHVDAQIVTSFVKGCMDLLFGRLYMVILSFGGIN